MQNPLKICTLLWRNNSCDINLITVHLESIQTPSFHFHFIMEKQKKKKVLQSFVNGLKLQNGYFTFT